MPSTLKMIVLTFCLALAACDADPEADIAAGTQAYLKNDFDRAQALWQPLAMAGNEEAAARLALTLYRDDAAKALQLASPAISSDIAVGQLAAALFQYEGIGETKNPRAAVETLESLSDCGMPIALNAHAAIRRELDQREHFTKSELIDLEAAALSGFTPAMYNLALQGLRNDDLGEGLKWLILANDLNHGAAKEMLDRSTTIDIPELIAGIASARAEEAKGSLKPHDPFACN